jgi:hypothetical protein
MRGGHARERALRSTAASRVIRDPQIAREEHAPKLTALARVAAGLRYALHPSPIIGRARREAMESDDARSRLNTTF